MIQDIHPHQFDNTYKASSGIQNNDYIFHFKEDTLLLKTNGQGFELPKKKDIENCNEEGIFLFSLNNKSCFLVWDCPDQNKEQLDYHEFKFPYNIAQKEVDWTAGVALHLRNWYQEHQFCGKCGAPTVILNEERAISCSVCNSIKYPKISPAIIVAILCNDKILLARGSSWPEGYFSLVAGYVDVGESIEDAVIREVKEEVGLEIKNIRYYTSQPWPFSGSMMIGFVAEANGEQNISVDNKEIAEAEWFTKDTLPNHPPDRSIAGEMIDKFIKGEL